jgi:hypothetical protein
LFELENEHSSLSSSVVSLFLEKKKMKSIFAFLIVCILFAAILSNAETFDPRRCHLVDFNAATNSFFFRGNQPSVGTKDKITFAYDQVVTTLGERAASFNISSFPALNSGKKLYLVDISFEWPFESGQVQSMEFFAKNPSLGEYVEWILIGDVIEPQWVSPADRIAFLENGTLWKDNKIIERIQKVKAMLAAGRQQVTMRLLFIRIVLLGVTEQAPLS